MANDLAVRASAIKHMIEARTDLIKDLLPKHITPERMLRIFGNALAKNPKLYECTEISIIGCCVMASELGLEPNTPFGHCYFIPYNNWNKQTRSKVMECTLQLGYQGLIELAYRSPKVKGIYVETVYANDTFKVSRGLNRNIIHEEAVGDRGEPVAYYAVMQLVDMDPMFATMSVDEVQKHAERFSPSYYKYGTKEPDPNGLYHSHPESYGLKTVIKKLCKYAPKSIELARAITLDEANGRVAYDGKDAIDVNFSQPEATDEEQEIPAPEPGKSRADAFVERKATTAVPEVVESTTDLQQALNTAIIESGIAAAQFDDILLRAGVTDFGPSTASAETLRSLIYDVRQYAPANSAPDAVQANDEPPADYYEQEQPVDLPESAPIEVAEPESVPVASPYAADKTRSRTISAITGMKSEKKVSGRAWNTMLGNVGSLDYKVESLSDEQLMSLLNALEALA